MRAHPGARTLSAHPGGSARREANHGLGDLIDVEVARDPELTLRDVAGCLARTRVNDGSALREGGEDLRRVGVVVSARSQRGEGSGGSRHPPVRLIGADSGDHFDAGHASRALGEGFPSTPLPHEHEARVPEPRSCSLEGVDEDLGGQPLGDRARVDEDGAVAGGESFRGAGSHGIGHAHAVGDDRDIARTQVTGATRDAIRVSDDAAGTAQRERLQPRDRAHDDARHARERGGVRDNVGAVVDVGDAARRARNADGGAGRRRGLGDDHVGARTSEQPDEEGQVERHVGDVSTHRSRAVAQDRGAAHLDEAGALPRLAAAVYALTGVAGNGGSQARGEDPDPVSTRGERAGERPEAQRGGRRLGCKGAGRQSD